MSTSIPYTVSASLYAREAHTALQAVMESGLSVEQLKLVKEFTIARDWWIHHPKFDHTASIKLGDFMPTEDSW